MVSDNENGLDFPSGLLFNDDSSWVKVENGVAVVGVSSFGALRAKEFVFIRLPEAGGRIKAGETYVSLEALKWSGHLMSPVSGEIVAVNDALFDEPGLINSDPYGSWVMRVKLSDASELEGLMDADAARKFYTARS